MARGRIDINVLTMSPIDFGHKYRPQHTLGYPHQYLGKAFRFRYLGFFHPGIFKVLSRLHADAYLSHIGSITGIIMTCFAMVNRKPLILPSDSIFYSKFQKVSYQSLREFAIRQLLKQTAAAWVPGKASQEYLEYYGLPKDRIFQGAYCLDIDYLLRLSEPARSKRKELRKQINVDADDFLFLFVGRMLPFRGVKCLLEAFYLVKNHFKNIKLLLIGDGPEKTELQAKAHLLGLQDIIFLDPLPMNQLTGYYVASDAYVTAALCENYSLALAQAAICGLPLISTDQVGAAKDYLVEGITGFVVPPGDSQAFAAAMQNLLTSKGLASAMGQEAAVLARPRTIAWGAEQLETAVFRALDTPK